MTVYLLGPSFLIRKWTVLAEDSADADSGLPSVSVKKKKKQLCFVKQSVSVVLVVIVVVVLLEPQPPMSESWLSQLKQRASPLFLHINIF